MGEQLVIRGVPARLARDGWWFSDVEDAGPVRATDAETRHLPPKALGALAVLIILADGLFWNVDLGISVAFYALALTTCILALAPKGVTRQEGALALAITVLCNLPVIEQVQALSLIFSGAGVIATLAWVAFGRQAGAWQAVVLFAQASFIGPLALPFDAAEDLRHARPNVDVKGFTRAVAMPLCIGGVFLILFTYANPLVETALTYVTSIEIFTPEQISRATFWTLGACFVWPYLSTRGRWRIGTGPARGGLALPSSVFVNARSVQTSLILFNVMFAVQTLSDLVVLSGGLALPDGLTYATYAQRGAYPLAVTALLSGVFAAATHRMIAGNKVLRGLMYLWLGQSLFLVLTAAARLGLYVDAYSLTYLRVAAFICMALIFIALILIVVQMLQNRPVAWLAQSNAIAITATLYLCCFVNFAYLIADYNISSTAPGEALDLLYLFELGEQAIPAMMEYDLANDEVIRGRSSYPALRVDHIDDWQEWGFRRWRLQRYLETYHDL